MSNNLKHDPGSRGTATISEESVKKEEGPGSREHEATAMRLIRAKGQGLVVQATRAGQVAAAAQVVTDLGNLSCVLAGAIRCMHVDCVHVCIRFFWHCMFLSIQRTTVPSEKGIVLSSNHFLLVCVSHSCLKHDALLRSLRFYS
jgi:hypothetical protein